MGWARVALMSRCGSGAARQQQPQNPSRSCRRTTSEANPSEQSCILYSDMLSQRTLPAPSTFPSPHSLALSRSSVSGASHLHLQRRSSSSSIGEKKREFLSFIRRFPRNPHPPPYLLHFSFYICTYIFVVSKKKRFLFL